MSRLHERKAAVIERIEEITDEHMIAAVENTLEGNVHYALSPAQRKELDASLARYLRGGVKTYSPAQVRARARKAMRG